MNEFGYMRAAAAAPVTVPGDVTGNLESILVLYKEAAEMNADLAVFPELVLSGYTCGDLFAQSRLLERVEEAAAELTAVTAGKDAPLAVFGLPVRRGGLLFNCAALAWGGKLLGLVPKTYLPNTREFYEQRWFTSGRAVSNREDFREISLGGETVPFGTDLLFPFRGDPRLTLGVEICEDLWSPLPPSIRQTVAGATFILNPSASNELVGKASYRKDLVVQQSARCLSGYLYVSSGPGESSTDTVYGGHALIAENGQLLAEGPRFNRGGSLIAADLDMDYLAHERSTANCFSQVVQLEGSELLFRSVPWGGIVVETHCGAIVETHCSASLRRTINPHPFVPSDIRDRRERCEEIFQIQSAGLATRLEHTGCRTAVIGLSGGLDSTLALLVTVQAFDTLGLDRKGILCITMPGFGTTGRTLGNAENLSACLGVTLETVDIRNACTVQLKDLGHSGEPSDTAYENVQARQRTALLMNKSNMTGGMVIGTGDLSELALGWCTYNGDHMSMYGVNAGVPKTLVRYLVDYVAETREDAATAAVLKDIIDTPISPELLPPDKEGQIAQKTEEVIGPFELHDFFLFQAIRCGFSPKKVYFLACLAFGKEDGPLYSPEVILKWLEVFYRRFFSQQFKRSCLPDGPKVGTMALSPRGDWRMPSDASAREWLNELKTIKQRKDT